MMGINPANGQGNEFRTPQDEEMMPKVIDFANNPTEDNFKKAMWAYKEQCLRWKGWWQRCAEVICKSELSPDEIAYSNCLPWRTASGTNFSNEVAEKTAKFYARPLIEELDPCLIVAMGQKAALILRMTGISLPKLITWNCSHALKESVKLERASDAKEILEFVKRKRG